MPRAPWAAWPGGDGQFSARDWDLQVPHSPRGALPEVPTHSGPAAGSDQGVHSHSPMAQLPLSPLCFPAPWPCSGAERRGSRSCHQGWHTHTLPLHPPRHLGLLPLLPRLGSFPTGPAVPGILPPGLTFHARSFQINILEPCRGELGPPSL